MASQSMQCSVASDSSAEPVDSVPQLASMLICTSNAQWSGPLQNVVHSAVVKLLAGSALTCLCTLDCIQSLDKTGAVQLMQMNTVHDVLVCGLPPLQSFNQHVQQLSLSSPSLLL